MRWLGLNTVYAKARELTLESHILATSISTHWRYRDGTTNFDACFVPTAEPYGLIEATVRREM